MTVIYESIPHRLHVLSWPESTPEELSGLIGAENVRVFPGGVQVRNAGQEWETLRDGWSATVTDKGERIVMSSYALDARYRRV